MKSSGAVFAKQNPFQPKSTQSLSKSKKTTSSSVRSKFHKPDDHFDTRDGKPVYSDVWPSDWTSPTPSSDTEALKPSEITRKSSDDFQLDSVLAKYIDRFRFGEPQSRAERQQMACATGEEEVPFWWKESSSSLSSSTHTKRADKDVIYPLTDADGQHHRDRPPSPHRGCLSIMSDTSLGDFDDSEIIRAQEWASELEQEGYGNLQVTLSECTHSDESIPVTSDGLGCSDFSSSVSVDEPLRRPLMPNLLSTAAKVSTGSAQAMAFSKSTVIPALVPPTCPEDDILFQWRSRRHLEKFRELSQSMPHSNLHSSTLQWQGRSLTTSEQPHKQQQSTQAPEPLQNPTISNMNAPRPETIEQPCPTSSDSSPFSAFVASSTLAPQPQAIARVPAHTHFLCEVLPCPIQASHTSLQESISHCLDCSTKVMALKTQTQSEKLVSASESCSSGRVEGGLACHAKRAETNKKVKTRIKQSDKSEKEAVSSMKEQKKTTGECSRQGVLSKVIPRKEQHLQTVPDSSGKHASPPSPVRSALGQVVSEVLFPTVDSSPAHGSAPSSVSRPCTPSESRKPSVLPCSAQSPTEVVSQLLHEAEDSDEKEFEDDPLLQGLRKQRKYVKEQISAVDLMLHGFQDEQQVV